MKRPPLSVVFVAVLMIAIGETSGAAMSLLRPRIAQMAERRVAANPAAHGLAGSAEYDAEVTRVAVYTAEAGLSFLHTHAQAMGPVVLLVGTLGATLVPWPRPRRLFFALVGIGGLFPLGYLVYAIAAVELGRDTGVALAERYVLAPLGGAAVAALLILVVALVSGRAGRAHARRRPA